MAKQERMLRVPEVRAAFILVASIVCFLPASRVRAQEDPRRLWDTEFLKKRPAAPASPAPPRTGPVYKSAAPDAGDIKRPGEMLGVTIWRLRPPTASDSTDSRLLLQEEDRSPATEWTPERVEAGARFAAGEPVRLGVESPRTGFLYVVDREQYDDGSTSDPYLIFPTLRINAGDNAVAAGRVIELPGRSAFRFKPMRPDYSGELLTFLVTERPLTEIRAAATIQKLDPGLVAQWERQWSSIVERFEMVAGAGQTYTKAEKEAGARARLLTQDDALPQTLFRVATRPGIPLMVAVPLRIAK